MMSFQAVSDVVYALRVEFAVLVISATLWFLHDRLGGSKARRGTSKTRETSFAANAPNSAGRRSPPPMENSSAAAPQGYRNPKPSQLRDPSWVAGAVQQLCNAEMQRGLDLYRNAIRAGLDLKRLSASESAHLFVALVTAAIRVGKVDEAMSLLRDCQRGPGLTPGLLTSAVKLCTSKQMFKECLDIYDLVSQETRLLLKDRSLWSCLLFCAVETSQFERCGCFFESIKACGTPSAKDYGNMIRCASQKVDWKVASSLVLETRKEEGVEIDNVVFNTALATCVAAGQMDEARALLDEFEHTEGLVDVITYNTLCKGYARSGNVNKCLQSVEHMRARNITPSQVTYGILLDCCINENDVDRAAQVFNEMTSSGCVLNTVLCTTLIKGFARAEQVDKAMHVYEKMCSDGDRGMKPDLITFSILIKANCDAGHLDVALDLFKAMKERSLSADEVVFNNLLGGCVRQGNADFAAQLYEEMVKSGLRPSNATFSILIRLYAQCKRLDEAVEMLKTQPQVHGVVAEARLFVQLAQACLRERQGQRAAEVYRLLLKTTTPSAAMHSSLLGMCAKLNMLETGAEILELAADASGRVDVRDATQLRDIAVRKRKTSCCDRIAAAMVRLGHEQAAA